MVMLCVVVVGVGYIVVGRIGTVTVYAVVAVGCVVVYVGVAGGSALFMSWLCGMLSSLFGCYFR